MKSFFHTCPLIVLTVLIAAIVVCSMGLMRIFPSPLPPENNGISAANTADSSFSSAPVASQTPAASSLPSSLPQTSAASKPASSAQSESARPAAKPESRVPGETGETPFRPVGKDYFNDALFVGDSLTEDLKKYGNLDNASYFFHVGLNIYQLFETPKPDALKGLTFERTLRNGRYRKIYIMLGINEMGTGNTAYFVRHYSSVLAKVRALQPNAILYIESILPVTAEKSTKDPVFNNPNIRERDAGLRTLANGKNIFYLDIVPAFADKSGNLRSEYSGDDVHLKAKYYYLWRNLLLKNAIPYENAKFS